MQILALANGDLSAKLAAYKIELVEKVEEMSQQTKSATK
jgi:phosphoribosylcarboxyaminoimidazole (NCAIR) mutase